MCICIHTCIQPQDKKVNVIFQDIIWNAAYEMFFFTMLILICPWTAICGHCLKHINYAWVTIKGKNRISGSLRGGRLWHLFHNTSSWYISICMQQIKKEINKENNCVYLRHYKQQKVRGKWSPPTINTSPTVCSSYTTVCLYFYQSNLTRIVK